MSTLIKLIQAFLPGFQTQKQLDEAYLAASADVYDLERRMREIDSARGHAQNLVFGNMMR